VPRPILRSLTLAALAAGTLAAVVPDIAGAQRAPTARGASTSADAPSIERLMAPWELEATGISRLSPAERRAVDAWLGRYTAALREGRGAASAGAAAERRGTPGAMDTIRPAPGTRPAAEPRSPTPPTRIAIAIDATPRALEVTAVYDGGDVIATDDGSLWETYLPDRFNAATWRVGQSVLVRNNPLPPRLSGPAFDVVLMNGETRTTAAARYAGRRRIELGAEDAPTGDGR
jgi:hypothetical protein